MLIGLLSDAHGNVEAFNLAVALLRREGAKRLYFLGDAVGYFLGSSVIDVMMKTEIEPILGNHEAMLLADDVPLESEGIYRLNDTKKALSNIHLAYMRRWPVSREVKVANGTLLMLHGSPKNPTYGYVYPDTGLKTFAVAAGTTVFMGNTHRPFIRDCDGARFVNIGSCGLPRDHGNLGAVCLFDCNNGEATILRFDISTAIVQAIARCGRPHESVEALFSRRSSAPVFGKMIYE